MSGQVCTWMGDYTNFIQDTNLVQEYRANFPFHTTRALVYSALMGHLVAQRMNW